MKSGSSIRRAADLLHVENALFEQRWQLGSGAPQLVYFKLAGGEPLVDAERLAGTPLAAVAPRGAEARVDVECGQLLPNEMPSVNAYVRFVQDEGKGRCYHFQVFDDVAGCIVRIVEPAIADGVTTAGGDSVHGVAAHTTEGGIEQDPPLTAAEGDAQGVPVLGAGELLPIVFSRPHPELTQVCFAEQSDHHSDFVFECTQQLHPSEKSIKSDANLLLLADPAGGEGLGFLLLAPSALVRSQWGSQAGYCIENSPPRLNGIGSLAKLLPTPEHYPLAVFAWRDYRDGLTQELHTLQRSLHVWKTGRDGLFLSNTWGDRGRGDRISERFVLDEIAVGERLGTDIIELDDGWQSGLTVNTKSGQSGVWNGFWASSPDFWKPSATAFPDGIDVVIRAAKAKGMQFGLWFAPDSSNDFANWEKDAQVLLGFWREHGIGYFKLDAIKLRTLRGERNLCRMLQQVQEESDGEILLDMDVTAEYRLTYWGSPSGSTLFLQNRYTDWSNYYPHQTLRALWTLSAYILPPRLRLEVLNPERNAGLYGSDPLRPAAYPPEYLLAITLPASGLGWFEHDSLSERVLDAWAPLLAVWKQHREAWYAGAVRRIGNAPNGHAWSGFVSSGNGALYLLVFRELNDSDTQSFTLPCRALASERQRALVADAQVTSCSANALLTAEGTLEAEVLAGVGGAVLCGNELRVTIPQAQQFLLARIVL